MQTSQSELGPWNLLHSTNLSPYLHVCTAPLPTHTYIIHNNDNKINLKPIYWKTQGSPVDLGSKLEEATQEVGA